MSNVNYPLLSQAGPAAQTRSNTGYNEPILPSIISNTPNSDSFSYDPTVMEQFLVDGIAPHSPPNDEARRLSPENDDLDEYENTSGNQDDPFQAADSENSSQLAQADDAIEWRVDHSTGCFKLKGEQYLVKQK
jgi:hypothetical protein